MSSPRVDFEGESLRDGLDRAGLDWSQPTFFSCLGVLIYLTAEAIDGTLRIVRECGAGSEIVVSCKSQVKQEEACRYGHIDADLTPM